IGARVGGDEFALILPQTTKQDATVVARRLCTQVRSLKLPGDIRLSISVGLAAYPEDGTSANALFAAADYAMYQIKYQGGGGFCIANLPSLHSASFEPGSDPSVPTSTQSQTEAETPSPSARTDNARHPRANSAGRGAKWRTPGRAPPRRPSPGDSAAGDTPAARHQ